MKSTQKRHRSPLIGISPTSTHLVRAVSGISSLGGRGPKQYTSPIPSAHPTPCSNNGSCSTPPSPQPPPPLQVQLGPGASQELPPPSRNAPPWHGPMIISKQASFQVAEGQDSHPFPQPGRVWGEHGQQALLCLVVPPPIPKGWRSFEGRLLGPIHKRHA